MYVEYKNEKKPINKVKKEDKHRMLSRSKTLANAAPAIVVTNFMKDGGKCSGMDLRNERRSQL